MNFSRKHLRLAAGLLGALFVGGVLAGCGNEAKSDEIKIGANFEMTGNVANYGAATLDGLKLAIKEVNDAGGVNGKKITIVDADNKSEASEAVNAATKLISDDKVKVIVGPAVTANVIAESQVATDNKVPVIAPDATSPDVTVENGQVKPYIFRSCFIDPQQGSVMAKFAAENLKAKTAVIYVDNSTDYSKSLGKVFKEKFEAAGGKVLDQQAFVAKDTDFKATLTTLKAANADVIFVPAYYEEVGKIVKQARELGIKSLIAAGDTWENSTIIENAGASAEGIVLSTFFDESEPANDEAKSFITGFKEYLTANKQSNVIPAVSALGYDAYLAAYHAIEKAQSTDGEAIKEALKSVSFDGVTGSGISFDENGDANKDMAFIKTVKDGKFEFLTTTTVQN